MQPISWRLLELTRRDGFVCCSAISFHLVFIRRFREDSKGNQNNEGDLIFMQCMCDVIKAVVQREIDRERVGGGEWTNQVFF